MHSGSAHPGGHSSWHGGRWNQEQEILRAYPDLEMDDIREALQFAAESVRERELPLVAPY